jgi:hypothetical protein
MNESRLERLAPLTGVVTVVLMMVGAALFGVYDYLPPADRLKEYISDNQTTVFLGGYLGSISAFFLIWFAGSVYSALREREGGTGRLSMVAFGGGVASGVALALGFTAIVAVVQRAGAEGGISPLEVVTIYDLYSQILGFMFAAFGLLTPISYIVLAFALVWLFVVSIWLYARGRATE